MDERDDARQSIEDARDRIGVLAEELARRASPAYVGARTKEVAMKKGSEYRERATTSPLALGILGGSIGTLFGMLAGRKQRERHEQMRASQRPYGYRERIDYRLGADSNYPPDFTYYPSDEEAGESRFSQARSRAEEFQQHARDRSEEYMHRAQDKTEDLKQRAQGKTEDLKQRAQGKTDDFKHRARDTSEDLKHRSEELKHRAKDTAEDLKHRAQGRADDLRSRAAHTGESMRERRESAADFYNQKMEDQPLFVGLGVLALGAATALLVPVSRRERKAIAPLKERAREQVETVGHEVERRIEGESQEEDQHLGSESGGAIITSPEEPVTPGGPIIH